MNDPRGPSRPGSQDERSRGVPSRHGSTSSGETDLGYLGETAAAGRVLLVTRHFWPHAAGRHERAAEATWLSQLWAAQGFRVEVVTPRYGTEWSPQLTLGDILVHRIAAAPRGQWSTQRYVRHLGHWIRDQRDRFDAVVCHTLGEDVPAVAHGVATAGRSTGRGSLGQAPQVTGRVHAAERAAPGDSAPTKGSGVRRRPLGLAIATGWGSDSDVQWCRQHRGGNRALQAANALDGVVTEIPATDRFLVAGGIAPEKLIRLPRGYQRRTRFQLTSDSGDVAGPPSPSERKEVRRVLAATNGDLHTLADTPVLLWCGAMNGRPDDPGRFPFLVRHARTLLARQPQMRIWLLGDGELRDWAHTELKAEGVRAAVAMPGSFVDMSDVFAAVDAVVQTDEDQLRWTLPTAIEFGVPVILQDTPLVRNWLESDRRGANDSRGAKATSQGKATGQGKEGGKAKPTGEAGELVAWYDPARPGSYYQAVKEIVDDLPAAYRRAGELCAKKARGSPQPQFANRWVTLIRQQSVAGMTDTNRSVVP